MDQKKSNIFEKYSDNIDDFRAEYNQFLDTLNDNSVVKQVTRFENWAKDLIEQTNEFLEQLRNNQPLVEDGQRDMVEHALQMNNQYFTKALNELHKLFADDRLDAGPPKPGQ